VLPAVHAGDGRLEPRQVLLPGLVQLAGDRGVEPDRGWIGQEPQVSQGMAEHVDVAHRWRLDCSVGRRLPISVKIADAVAPPYRPLILFAAYTGLRPSELVALRVGRLDLLRGTARVVEAAVEVSRLQWGPVKTHEARTVRMPRSVAELLGAYLTDRPHDPDALVFTAPMGGPLDRGTFVRSVFRPAIRAANEAIAKLPKDRRPAPLPEGLRLYDLRHTCASLLIAQGASVKAVQAQLGHATASITLDTYGHLFPSELEVLADQLEQVRGAALARRLRTDGGPGVVPLRETAGG
jgi:integrase